MTRAGITGDIVDSFVRRTMFDSDRGARILRRSLGGLHGRQSSLTHFEGRLVGSKLVAPSDVSEVGGTRRCGHCKVRRKGRLLGALGSGRFGVRRSVRVGRRVSSRGGSEIIRFFRETVGGAAPV